MLLVRGQVLGFWKDPEMILIITDLKYIEMIDPTDTEHPSCCPVRVTTWRWPLSMTSLLHLLLGNSGSRDHPPRFHIPEGCGTRKPHRFRQPPVWGVGVASRVSPSFLRDSFPLSRVFGLLLCINLCYITRENRDFLSCLTAKVITFLWTASCLVTKGSSPALETYSLPAYKREKCQHFQFPVNVFTVCNDYLAAQINASIYFDSRSVWVLMASHEEGCIQAVLPTHLVTEMLQEHLRR